MSRPQALAVSILLALAAASGAFAVSSTGALRSGPTKPEVASAQALARRARQLDAWEASLGRALRSRPPALPALPRYGPLARVRGSAAGALPALVISRRPATRTPKRHHAREATTAAAVEVRSAAPVHADGGAQPPPSTTTTVAAPPAAQPAAPAEPSTPAAASVPPPAAPASSAPQVPSVEQQCEQLKKAAEGQGEAAKRAAERKCEQLKHAAEGSSGGDGGSGSGEHD